MKGAGGLVTALSSLAAATHAVWVAIARDDSDRALMQRGDPASLMTDDGTEYKVAFVDPGREAYDLYYSGPHLHMIVLREHAATYWVVNTLLDSLSNETMIAIAKGLKPLAAVK